MADSVILPIAGTHGDAQVGLSSWYDGEPIPRSADVSQEPPQEPRPDDQSPKEQAAEVQTGPADSSIQPYDFRRPERFSKDQL